MKIFCWEPESYGPWVHILAQTEAHAKEIMKVELAKKEQSTEWDAKYDAEHLREWIARPADRAIDAGIPIYGEVC